MRNKRSTTKMYNMQQVAFEQENQIKSLNDLIRVKPSNGMFIFRFFCVVVSKECLCTQLYQIFSTNTNNLNSFVWFQVFLSNTNNYMVSSN